MRRTVCLALGLLPLAASPTLAAPHTITINTVQIFGTIDPAKISDYTDYMASANLYDGLANVDPKGNLVPELAEKWDVSPDASERHLSSSGPTRSSRTARPSGGGRRLFRRAAAEDQSRPRQSVRRRAEARQRRGDRRQDGQVQSVEDVLAVPGHRAGDPHRQFQARQGECRQRRRPDLSRDPCRQRRPLHAQELGPRHGDDDRSRSQLLSRLGRRSDRRGALRHHQRRGDRALDGRLGRTDDVEPVSVARHLRRARQDAALQDRQGRNLGRLLSQAQHQGRADRRRAYPQGDRARDRLRHDPRHDPARRRSDGAVAQDLRRGAPRQPAPKFDLEAAKAEIAKSAYAGKTDIPLSLDLRLRGQVRGGDRRC